MTTIKRKCWDCGGKGYRHIAGQTYSSGKEVHQIMFLDCNVCNGTGMMDIEIIDNRKITKDKEINGDDY